VLGVPSAERITRSKLLTEISLFHTTAVIFISAVLDGLDQKRRKKKLKKKEEGDTTGKLAPCSRNIYLFIFS
jgi:hypothetical protein